MKIRLKLQILFVFLQSSCGYVEYFKAPAPQRAQNKTKLEASEVLGQPLGLMAGKENSEALAAVHAISTNIPPAIVRPDPDLYASKLVQMFRQEGLTAARLNASIQAYRPLLGGASPDFQKRPQEDFDSTSLLSTMSVSQTVCQGLVNPNAWQHPGWDSILPSSPQDWRANIRFLIQRITGQPSMTIQEDQILQLKSILDLEKQSSDVYTSEDYTLLCALLTIDAEAQSL